MTKRKEQEGSLNKKEILYIDVLRILACFLVIINHTNGFILKDGHDSFASSTFYCLMFAICKIGVGLFLMITGALILKKNYDYKKIIKCIVRVFVPVFVFSLGFYISKVGFGGFNLIDFLKRFIVKPILNPYWYIYALLGIYCVVPFIQKMLKNFKKKDYVVFLGLFLVIPTILLIVKAYFSADINRNFQLAFFPIVIAFVVCGDFVARVKPSRKYLIWSIVTFIVAYVLMFLSLYVPYLVDGKISYTLDSWNNFLVVTMSATVFYIVRYFLDGRELSLRTRKVISVVASTTFGIYLIHTMINHRIYDFWVIQEVFSFNPIVGAVVLNLTVFIIGAVIVYALKKIPYVKKFL